MLVPSCRKELRLFPNELDSPLFLRILPSVESDCILALALSL